MVETSSTLENYGQILNVMRIVVVKFNGKVTFRSLTVVSIAVATGVTKTGSLKRAQSRHP